MTRGKPRAGATRPPGRNLIEIAGLDVSYGRSQALRGVSLGIPRGARAALLGPNGAGKSTLIKAICGALEPDSGQVLLAGLRPARAILDPGLLGWLPEGAPLNPDLSVLEHLELACRLRGLDKAGGQAEIGRLASALDLRDKLPRLAGGLSMGSRRQAALALALLAGPRLLVLDEPTSSLDPDQARRFAMLMGALPETTTLLISSHILSEVAPLTSLAIFLDRGRLAGYGPWEDWPGGSADPARAYFGVVGQ
ncbi:MAG: ABC transporter ATP-binding protein [Deltaproteobacteria bacterium]|nr:ABC transporter ATP-binding protein [Deltaproteobacteria bacterium]